MKKGYLTFLTTLMYVMVLAQESGGAETKVDVDINTDGGGNWYASPWVWVVGAAIFILLLVALTRGNGRRSD